VTPPSRARREACAGGTQQTSARELLDKRLTRGEVDTDEYQQRRRALEEPVTRS